MNRNVTYEIMLSRQNRHRGMPEVNARSGDARGLPTPVAGALAELTTSSPAQLEVKSCSHRILEDMNAGKEISLLDSKKPGGENSGKERVHWIT